jgi:carbonic anhydrase/acetyltransferase-like protein (isoleucine patch superfamily)
MPALAHPTGCPAPPPLLFAPCPSGDTHAVRIGHSTNLQDGVRVGSLNPGSKPTHIGSHVSVGHGAVLQGCTVQDKVLVGMNAVLQEGVTVRAGAWRPPAAVLGGMLP